MTTASAPAKIILFGEHAVVYGQPALAVPVTQLQATAAVSAADRPGVWIEAPDIGLSAAVERLPTDDPLRAAVTAVLSVLQIASAPACRIEVRSTIPVASGLGSGAAVTVAVLRAFSSFLGRPLDEAAVNRLAFEVEKLHHGTPSGIDNTVVTYARPVYFVKDRPIETLRVGAPLNFVIADSGVAAPTRESVGDVRALWQARPALIEPIFEAIGRLVVRARRAIEAGETAALGPLMDENHALLQKLTVSSPELDRLVAAARTAGALGAKLSGGGRGGNSIALVAPQRSRQVAQALLQAGARQVFQTEVT